MNLHLLLFTLRSRLGLFALVLCGTVIAALVVSLLLPKTYRATVSLLVDGRDEQSMSPSAPRAYTHPLEKVNYMQTQTDILTSDKVARRVAQDLKLAEKPGARAAFEKAGAPGAIEDWLGRSLLPGVKVDSSQSSIMHVHYQASDPRAAAELANAFARAYIDTSLELRTGASREASVWFDEQLKTLRTDLQDAQAKLVAFQKEKGIVSIDDRTDSEAARLAELQTTLVRAQGERMRPSDAMASPYIQTLRAELVRGEAKLQELSTQYGPNYPTYQRQVTENQSLRERIDAEMRKVASGYQSSARQTEAGIAGALAAQRDRMLQQRSARAEAAVLARHVDAAQRAYETALQRSVTNKVESRAAQGNISVLSPAAEPRFPARPRIGLNLILAAVVGTMLGLGIVVLMEMLDRRVRTGSDLAAAPDVPLLAVLNTWDPAAQNRRLLPWSGGAARTLPRPA